jgi:MYXO-CTERM domain-containing protein
MGRRPSKFSFTYLSLRRDAVTSAEKGRQWPNHLAFVALGLMGLAARRQPHDLTSAFKGFFVDTNRSDIREDDVQKPDLPQW